LRDKSLWLLVIGLVLASILLAACPGPNTEPEGPTLTPEEEEQMAQRGVVNVDTVADASRIAGFTVAEPDYIPEGFSGGSFGVYQHGANLPEDISPKFVRIEVQSFYVLQGEERIMFILAQSQHKSTISGGEPAEICGHPGERWFDAAHDDMPPRLAFGWEDNGYYFALMSILDGPLDEETLMQIACSVKVE